MGAATEELTERAKLLISERRYQEAVRACRRALLSHPGQIEICLLLGEALLALERYDEVRVEMMALARKVPDRAVVHRLLGEAYLRDSRPTQAIESLRRALQLDPDDEVAQELIAEAADESAPVSTTIERWFADEAEPTIETESPAWEEECTPVPGATHPSALVPAEPSIQVDPSLVAEALAAKPATNVLRGPRPRSRTATISGHADFTLSPAPAADAPLPPPPQATRPSPRPAPEPLSNPLHSPFAEESTNAARPSAMRALVPEPVTDELSIEELLPVDLSPVRIMEGELTRMRPGQADDPAPIFGGYPEPDSIDEDSPTLAFGGPLDVEGALGGVPTQTHAPGAPSEIEPPNVDHYPAPRYKSTPYAEPDEPPTAPVSERPRPGVTPQPDLGPPVFQTPAVQAAALQPASPRTESTDRVRKRLPRWVMPAVASVLGLLVVVAVVAVGVSIWVSSNESQELRTAAAAAGDSGSREAIDAVVASLEGTDDQGMLALRARLIATLVYEHDQDRAGEVREIVASITAAEGVTDARVAASLVALSEGSLAAALSHLNGLEAQGEQISEAYRARAFVMTAKGEWEEAVGAAREAVNHRPSAPRHIALYALCSHMSGTTGRTTAALTLLDGTPDAQTQPAIRVVRARILADTGRDPAQAVEEARAVIEELGERATPRQLAWAHLIVASHGPPDEALTEARAAAEHAPPLDEVFRMQLVEVFLRRGAAEEADVHLGQLSETVVIDVEARALLTAEVALAVNQLSRADEALGNAGTGHRQALLRAQILEARGQSAAARPLYERVMNEAPGPERRSAAVRLAQIEMAEGNTTQVVALLEPRLSEAVDDLELVPLLARAYLSRDRLDDANRIVDAALRRRPGATELAAVRGSLLLASGSAGEALPHLVAAAEARPRDARVQADLGRANQLSGNTEEAVAAYEATLEVQPTNAIALVGLAQIAFAAGDFDQAEERAEAVASTGEEGLAAARLRAQLQVIRGAGASGVNVVRPLTRRHDDAILWTALGDLYAQIDNERPDRSAGRAYERALQVDPSFVKALIGQSILHIRAGTFSRAQALLTRAEEAGGAEMQPSIEAARGWLAFERSEHDTAVTHANRAIESDAQLSSPHLLLATIAIERGQDPVPHLRRAVAAHAPPPQALGQLASRLVGEEACVLARRYLLVAPGGLDASDVRPVVAGQCH